jgi:hypothetical protein
MMQTTQIGSGNQTPTPLEHADAPNLDCHSDRCDFLAMTIEEQTDLATRASQGDAQRFVNTALIHWRRYAHLANLAHTERRYGKLQAARYHEDLASRIYALLPAWARW